MELFHKANAIRLRSHHDKYLVAEKDEESVTQDRKGKSSDTSTTWNVELVQGGNFIRLKSCYGKYLTASDDSFHLGMAGKKVVQTLPTGLEDSSSIEWEPIRDNGHQFKLRSRSSGEYLRANGGLPPLRNSVTHDVPHRSSTQDWILWEVDILDMQVQPIVEVAKPKEEKEGKPKEKKEAKLFKSVLAMKRPKGEKEAKSKEEKPVEEEGEGEGEEEEEKESEESEDSEEEGGEGSPHSRFGFRKFLHKLKGDGEEDQEEGEGEAGGEGEDEGEGGSPHSRFGFRKFLHELAGDGEEGEEGEEGGEAVEFEFEF